MKNLLPFFRYCILFLFFLCSSIISKSQNWNPLPFRDTTYYYVFDPIPVPLKVSPYNYFLQFGSGILNVIWVDSAISLGGGDSLFKFQPTLSQPLYEECIDTAGPTPFGYQYIKTASGTYYFFNASGDSMRIEPTTPLNGSWTFYNKNGLQFQAIVDMLDTQQVNGIVDSIKYISVYTNQSGGSAYNNYFILSQHNGFLQNFSFANFLTYYAFEPYRYLEPSFYKDTASLMDYAIEKYQPGNYWNGKIDTSFVMGNSNSILFGFYDTVISSTIIPPNQIEYTIKEKLNGTTSIITRTETFSTTPINYLEGIYPGYYKPNSNYTLQEALKRYDVSTLSDSSCMVCSTNFKFPTIFDSCLHSQIQFNNYEITKHCLNRYFNNLSSTNINYIGPSSTPYNSNTSEILFYKLGEHVYIPYRPVPLNSILLTGQFNENNFTKLNWVTTGEKNIASFEVQRSNSAGIFEHIATLNSQGDSEDDQYYSYRDDISTLKKSKNILYRILVRDIDGHTSYSNIIHVSNHSNNIASIFPNPVSTELNITLNSMNHGDIKITLSDVSGRVLLTDKIPSTSSISTKIILIPSTLKTGVYFVEIVDEESGMKEMQKVMVNY